jgi:hypothetical protein
VDYAISTSKNLTTTPQQYIFDLIAAMDIVAAETAQQIIIATGVDDTRRQRKLLRETEIKRRRLAVKVRLPTRIARLENVTNSQEEGKWLDYDAFLVVGWTEHGTLNIESSQCVCWDWRSFSRLPHRLGWGDSTVPTRQCTGRVGRDGRTCQW